MENKLQEEAQTLASQMLNACQTIKAERQEKQNEHKQTPQIIDPQAKFQSIMNQARDVLTGKENLKANNKIENFHENMADLGSVFLLERKIFNFVVRLLFAMIILFIILLIALICILPLKEKEPYLVTFANDTQNFAIVQKADATITNNEALNRQLIGAYILNRETINQIDDKEKREVIREQSNSKVWREFENIVAQNESIYTNPNLQREVKIINISIIANKKEAYIATADIEVKLLSQGILKSQKRYKVTLAYKFIIENIIDYASMPKNPTGFKITNYSVTEIATIKELNKENQIHQSSGSKIKYKGEEKKDEKKTNDYSYSILSDFTNEGNQENQDGERK